MAGKIQIPDELKQDLPQTKWGKTLGATPIVMTVIATMLAGLASSEMTKAQYDRSLAAQLQSKAGDQWSYYQAKKLRSAVARNSLDVLAATAEMSAARRRPCLPGPMRPPSPRSRKTNCPPPRPRNLTTRVKAALDAVENSEPETEITAALAKVKPDDLGGSA